jgi:ribosomal protein L11 methylase PrmA
LCTYAADENRQKEEFVSAALRNARVSTVLDAGCNSGRFSKIALNQGANYVVAFDTDPAVVDELWLEAHRQQLNLLPLVINLARPTPGTGWRSNECSSFMSRASGAFDMVLMLALIHHLVITERVPLCEIFRLAADLTRRDLIIEYVGNTDPMFQTLLRGRGCLHEEWSAMLFEREAQRHFHIVHSQRLGSSDRLLYHLRKLE